MAQKFADLLGCRVIYSLDVGSVFKREMLNSSISNILELQISSLFSRLSKDED